MLLRLFHHSPARPAHLLALMVALALTASAQRPAHYHPDGRAFTVSNGSARYTRALYGGYTEWRLETSDRPAFAIYKKGAMRHIGFRLEGLALDSTSYCRADYVDGLRSYTLADASWGSGTLSLVAAAPTEREAAVWRIAAHGFPTDAHIQVEVSKVRHERMSRMGDLGLDAREKFDAGEPITNRTITIKPDEEAFIAVASDTADIITGDEARQLFDKAEAHGKELYSRIVFDTPDPYINTLGGALATAADGDWDGKTHTWLHGCIGWRMPLAGWRAGFIADKLGWREKAREHFDAYARSQVTDRIPTLPHPTQDAKMNLARAEKRWGTQMYSDGYICRNPDRNDQMHHYDMNLNYIDELLTHFQIDADTAYMRRMWPVLTRHLAWEKRNFDPDGDHLYDAYCCIWASDALYYSGGAATHSSAYNYRANRLAARIADIIGEDGSRYATEADAILTAMNNRLWLDGPGHWAECQDLMGLQRVHDNAAAWSIYTPIDCGAGTPEQMYRASRYVEQHLPHFDVAPGARTIATTDWLPYDWSINNVAPAEVMHTALAMYQAGNTREANSLLRGNVLDQMYLGASPANFGQLSYYDAARGECYRDFGDVIGISARTLIEGLFGITPEALYGRCVIRPGFPKEWNSASVSTPYIRYKWKRENGRETLHVEQSFTRPLQIVWRQNTGRGQYVEIAGNDDARQTLAAATPERIPDEPLIRTAEKVHRQEAHCTTFTRIPIEHNASIADIFEQDYLTPRPPYTTLQIPSFGFGEWCKPTIRPHINDSVWRTMIKDDSYTIAGVPFTTKAKGANIAYTSLWDNYPDSITFPTKTKKSWQTAYLLMAGSTNHMQCHIANAIVVARYTDGTADTLTLTPPDNWCPIEQDYYIDGKAFQADEPRPWRLCLGTGQVSRHLGDDLGLKGAADRFIPGGAAQMIEMPINPNKRIKSFTLRTLSNDVVAGMIAITLGN